MTKNVPDKVTDVLIVWGWIVWSTFHHLLWYTQWNIKSVLVDRQPQVGMLNSEYTQNSQTLHEGDIESNYKTIEKIRTVHSAAAMYKSFLFKQWHDTEHLYKQMWKMLLGKWKKEVDLVTKRYEWLTLQEKVFPSNQLLEPDEIQAIEPVLFDNHRNLIEPLTAYYNPNWLAIDFWKTCETLVDVTKKTRGELGEIVLGNWVKTITRANESGDLFDTELEDGMIIRSNGVVVSAGWYTPVLMKEMGYGDNIGILSIAGNYYRIKFSNKHWSTPKINNKVYTVQKDGLPFAALHMDPEVDDPNIVRLGPTAFGIPYLEKKKWTSFFDYLGILNVKHDLKSFISIMSNEVVRTYVIRNFKYLLPFYGKWLFLKEARKIIPWLGYNDIERLEWRGGTRPQIIDRTTHALNFGEAKVFGKGENLIFNITPSPWASTAFGNAYNDVQSLLQMDYFGSRFTFDKEMFEKNFGRK